MAQRRTFSYEIVDLIKLIEARPCLWDKTKEIYKNQPVKRKAWMEVFIALEEDYLSLDAEQQRKIENIIYDKWRNLRDAFSRSMKKRSQKSTTRKYLYYNNLKFLIKVFEKEMLASNFSDYCEEGDVEIMEIKMSNSEPTSPSPVKQETNHSRKRKRESLEIPDPIDEDTVPSKMEQSFNPIHMPDEDESFFASVLPAIRSMDLGEKLEFRIEVLNVIKKIKARNRPV